MTRPPISPERIAAARDDEIRDRDGWRCTATVQPRTFTNAHGTYTIPREPRRCSVVGSEMVVERVIAEVEDELFGLDASPFTALRMVRERLGIDVERKD